MLSHKSVILDKNNQRASVNRQLFVILFALHVCLNTFMFNTFMLISKERRGSFRHCRSIQGWLWFIHNILVRTNLIFPVLLRFLFDCYNENLNLRVFRAENLRKHPIGRQKYLAASNWTTCIALFLVSFQLLGVVSDIHDSHQKFHTAKQFWNYSFSDNYSRLFYFSASFNNGSLWIQ